MEQADDATANEAIDTRRAVAIQAGATAGRIQREHFETLLQVDEARKNDIKLEVDRLCEAAILEAIAAGCPDDAVLAEEGGGRDGTSGYRWIVDPLDGTVNYFYGVPYFCTSVACYREPEPADAAAGARDLRALLGSPVVGVVENPLLAERFVGVVGRGATRNDQPIRASGVENLGEAMVATGFGSTRAGLEAMFHATHGLAERVRKLRCLGAAALDLTHVACGRLTGFVEKGLHPWDIAAAAVILTEAGAVVDAFEYTPGRWDVIGCAAGIHRDLVALLRNDSSFRA